MKLDDYGKAGGIGSAISLHAEAWKKIKGDSKKACIARQLFLQLCDISPDGQIIRRRPRVAEVAAVVAGASIAEIQEVVHIFQEDDRNFILPSRGRLSSEDLLDISHEALLRQWRRFADDWQTQERDDASELRRLAELAGLRRRGLLPAEDLDRITHWQARTSPEWAQRYVKKETWGGCAGLHRSQPGGGTARGAATDEAASDLRYRSGGGDAGLGGTFVSSGNRKGSRPRGADQ
jgi:hypothetical protein